jgi:hypothetical protein
MPGVVLGKSPEFGRAVDAVQIDAVGAHGLEKAREGLAGSGAP